MMKLKGKMGACLLGAAVLVVSVSASVFASSQPTFTAAQAKALAAKKVPEGSTYLRTKIEDNKYEVKFFHKAKQERYEVEVNRVAEKITEFQSERVDVSGSKNVKLTQKDANAIVMKEFPKAEILSTALTSDDGLKEYKVRFKTDVYDGTYEINPATGVILEREINVTKRETTKPNGNKPAVEKPQKPSVTDQKITEERVKQILLEKVPGATIVELKTDREDGRLVYEGEMYKDGDKYEFEIDALTGQITDWDMDRNDDEDWDD